jgi:hypothetical protein
VRRLFVKAKHAVGVTDRQNPGVPQFGDIESRQADNAVAVQLPEAVPQSTASHFHE